MERELVNYVRRHVECYFSFVLGLKELIVCVKLGYEYEQLPEETPFISMISVWHALEMMPNLRTKFVYEEPSPPSPYEGRYKEGRLKSIFIQSMNWIFNCIVSFVFSVGSRIQACPAMYKTGAFLLLNQPASQNAGS